MLILSPTVPESILAGFPEIEVIRTSMVAPRDPLRLAGKISERLLGRNFVTERLLRAHGIVLLSHDVPRALPDTYEESDPGFSASSAARTILTPSEIERRDRNHRRFVAQATTVVLSSYDAQKDLARLSECGRIQSPAPDFVSGLGVSESLQRSGYSSGENEISLPRRRRANSGRQKIMHCYVHARLQVDGRCLVHPVMHAARGPLFQFLCNALTTKA